MKVGGHLAAFLPFLHLSYTKPSFPLSKRKIPGVWGQSPQLFNPTSSHLPTRNSEEPLIPVPKAVLMEIENYLAVRNTLTPLDQNPFLFAGRKQKGLTRYHICPVFQKALKDIGLDRQRKILGDITFGAPNPHSLRHSFAINTLNGIKKRGKSPQHALPVLATYMGHARFQYTGAYLKVSDPKDVQGLIDFSKSQLDVI